MPYEIVETHPECTDEAKPIAVIKTDDETLMGCHATTEDAQAQIAALEAEEEDGEDNAAPSRGFKIRIALEEVETSDGRIVASNALGWRELPIPLMFQKQNKGHYESVIAGRIETIDRAAITSIEGANEIIGTGTYAESPEGDEAMSLVEQQMLRWVSMDLDGDSESEMLEEGDCEGEGPGLIELLLADASGEDGEPCRFVTRFTKGTIMGVTIVPFPAFAGAVIVPADKELPPATEMGAPAIASGALVAHATRIPVDPPADWFENPQLSEPTALTVTEDGRILGHAWLWGECHVGRADACIVAPYSQRDYVDFMLGATKCKDGCEIATGVLTMGGDHAPLDLDAQRAGQWYADVSMGVADVVIGEDAWGGWISGAIRPGVTDEQLRVMRAAKLSGDWRPVGLGLELIALHFVNTPGFPVRRVQARVASGKTMALVASAGPLPPNPIREAIDQLDRRLAAVESVTRPLRASAASAIVERVRAAKTSENASPRV